jgi:tetratricopeptide (TPR) repeat protein
MRRIDFFGLAALYVIAFLLASCSKTPEAPPPKNDEPTPVVIVDDKKLDPVPPPKVDDSGKQADTTATPAGLSKQEKYDAALLEALNLIADHKYTDALLKMAEAKAIDDTEQIRDEIDKLKQRINQSIAAEQTTQDIKTVLDDGKPQDASRLATDGLQQYGGDNAEKLANLKRQAETLTTVEINDKAARRKALLADAEAALKDKNLRAAAIAYEQALQLGDDDDLHKQVDDLHATLARYDDNRQKAAELRRDPVNLEDAIAALREAQAAWDTLQVRQDLDNYTLALQKRRDRLSVADFEVRGEVGIPAAGRELAEDLMPAFKARYDLVERAQVGKIMDELKLQASDLADNDHGREEIGRIARVRYLVLGSVTPIGGITVHARLVDVRSGLVIQTAKIVAPTPEDLIQQLPDLAAMLQMNDQDKMEKEQQLAKQAKDIKEVDPKADLPEPPVVLAVGQAPPRPIDVFALRPPVFADVKIADFANFPPPPPPGQVLVPPPVVIVEEAPVRERMLRVAIELGDNAFRRRRFREAHFQFGFAMNLFPERREVRMRADQVTICLPPNMIPGHPGYQPIDPPPVIVGVPPPPPVWPRIAVMNFMMFTDPQVASPALSGWFADNIAPYFSPPYEVVDRNYVFWYMRRVGMSYRDLLTNAQARRWLGRALNLRYFVFGTVNQVGNSLVISTYMVDTEFGFARGTGVVRIGLGLAGRNDLEENPAVQVASTEFIDVAQGGPAPKGPDPATLRMHLANLAKQTVLDPKERDAYVKKSESAQELIAKGRDRAGKGDYAGASDLYQQALKLEPTNMEAKHLADEADRQAKLVALEADRKKQAEERRKLLAGTQEKQTALARDAEKLRVQAVKTAATLDDAQKRARETDRETAYNRLVTQAQTAQKQNNYKSAVQLYESAVALKPNDDGFHQLALARAKVEEIAKADSAAAQAARDKAATIQREKDLAKAREQIDQDRRKREDQEKALKARDDAEYERLLEAGEAALAKEKFDDAATSLQAAKQIHNTDEVNKLLNTALIGQAKAAAAKKGEAAKAELDKQLADEKQKRDAAEAEIKKNSEKYNDALKLAQEAMTQKKYAQAAAKYQEALKVHQTDAALTGLRAAQDAQAKEQKAADDALAKQVAEQKRADDLKKFLDEGQKALAAKKYDEAIQAFTHAKNLVPTDVDALAGLSKAQHAKDEALALAKKNEGDAESRKIKQAQFDGLIKTGRDAMVAKKYDAAVKAFTDAGKIFPDDKTWQDYLRQAEKAATDAKTSADKQREEEKIREQIKALVADARTDIKAGKFDAAAKAIADAKKLDPKNADVLQASKDLDEARTQAANDDLKKKHEADYQKALKTGRDALAVKKYDDAIKAFNDAGKLLPDDKAWKDLLKQAEDGKKKKGQEEELQQLVSSAEADIKAGKLDAAAKALADAKKIDPKDPGVVKASQDLDAALTAAKDDTAKKQRQADYEKAIKAGREALTAKKYADAIKAFTEAGKVMPGDKDAATLLKQAQQAQTDAQAAADAEAKKKKEEEKRNADFAKLMDQAQTQMAAKKYSDAVSTYNDALKLKPGDAKASSALKNAEFQQHMAEGQRLLNAKKFSDAASEFQEALKLFPDDANAKALLKKAKDGK